MDLLFGSAQGSGYQLAQNYHGFVHKIITPYTESFRNLQKSVVETMSPSYGPLIRNPYAPIRYHIQNKGPYLKPQPNKEGEGKGPSQGKHFKVLSKAQLKVFGTSGLSKLPAVPKDKPTDPLNNNPSILRCNGVKGITISAHVLWTPKQFKPTVAFCRTE